MKTALALSGSSTANLVLPTTARIAQIVPRTEAEGPGQRFAVWFQGCPLRCPGCCNPEFLKFEGGQEIVLSTIIDQFAKSEVEGISLLGGEPFAHAGAGLVLAQAARTMNRSVMIYSGFTLAELQSNANPFVQELLRTCDLLVDGPFRREEPELTRRWIGSRNQQLHFLTDRYHANEPCFRMPNTLEIRVEADTIIVNGFPALSATSLWKGWQRKRTSTSATKRSSP